LDLTCRALQVPVAKVCKDRGAACQHKQQAGQYNSGKPHHCDLMFGVRSTQSKVYSLSLTAKPVRLLDMESDLNHHAARALLEWQVELGATDAIGDVPIDRYALPDTAPKAKRPAAVVARPSTAAGRLALGAVSGSA